MSRGPPPRPDPAVRERNWYDGETVVASTLVRTVVRLALGGILGLAAPGLRECAAQAAPIEDASALRNVESALARKDHAAAYQVLLEAYRERRSPLVLYFLGELAAAQGRRLEARDLMRRYLAEASEDGSPRLVAAQRIVGSLDEKDGKDGKDGKDAVRPPSAEVSVLGPAGALVFADERLVGALPLSRPLLLGAGDHKLGLEYKQNRIADRVRVFDGRGAEVRFDLTSELVVVSQAPALLLLPTAASRSAALPPALREGLKQATQQHSWLLIQAPAPPPNAGAAGSATACPLSCQREAAAQVEVEHVLIARAATESEAELTLVDVVVGEPIDKRVVRCPQCLPPQLQQAASAALTAQLNLMSARGRGALTVTTTPPGANLLLDDRPWAVSPVSKRLQLGGDYELAARLPGYKTARQRFSLPAGQTAQLEVVLQPGEDTAPRPRPVRSPQGRIAGAIGLGGTVLLVSVGAALVAIDGSCSPLGSSACAGLYDTRAGGGVLIGSGLALGIASAVLLGVSR